MAGRFDEAGEGASLRPGRRFHFELVPFITTVLGLAVLVALGTWQLNRLAWKNDLIATASARLAAPPEALPEVVDWANWDFRRVIVNGHYTHDSAVALGLASDNGQLGADLLVPFQLEDGRTLIVDRGYLPDLQLPPHVPEALEPLGPQRLTGVLRVGGGSGRNWFTPDNDLSGRHVYAYDWPDLEQLAGGPLVPVVLRLEQSDGAQGLPRPGPTSIDFRNAHLGYAITWYALAAGLTAVYLLFSLRPAAAR